MKTPICMPFSYICTVTINRTRTCIWYEFPKKKKNKTECVSCIRKL